MKSDRWPHGLGYLFYIKLAEDRAGEDMTFELVLHRCIGFCKEGERRPEVQGVGTMTRMHIPVLQMWVLMAALCLFEGKYQSIREEGRVGAPLWGPLNGAWIRLSWSWAATIHSKEIRQEAFTLFVCPGKIIYYLSYILHQFCSLILSSSMYTEIKDFFVCRDSMYLSHKQLRLLQWMKSWNEAEGLRKGSLPFRFLVLIFFFNLWDST